MTFNHFDKFVLGVQFRDFFIKIEYLETSSMETSFY